MSTLDGDRARALLQQIVRRYGLDVEVQGALDDALARAESDPGEEEAPPVEEEAPPVEEGPLVEIEDPTLAPWESGTHDTGESGWTGEPAGSGTRQIDLPDELPEDVTGAVPVAAPEADPAAFGHANPDRYERMERLGMGGMGEVLRVRDRLLQRTMAMKLMRTGKDATPMRVARFIEEAQVAAQLHHPGIVPVHDLGRLPDGRLFFTMEEVRGLTLSQVIQAVHQARGEVPAGLPAAGWTLRRLVDAFHRICETVGYAHARGVVHRDLKPDNAMLGSFGRVLVLDWGLARVGGRGPGPALDSLGGLDSLDSIEPDDLRTARSGRDSLATRMGAVAGTPSYMAPEQAAGRTQDIGPHTDVWALGAILYEILAGRRAYQGRTALDTLELVCAGPPPKPRGGALPVPEGLWRLCQDAMTHPIAARLPDAGALADGVRRWLDGAAQRQRALEQVARADQLLPEVQALRDEARDLQQRGDALLAEVPAWAPVDRKAPAWRLQDEAARKQTAADVAESEWLQALHAALSADPELPEARDRLALHHRHQHEAAEAAQDDAATRTAAMMLRIHDRGRHRAYLQGDGRLTLHTEPADATAALFRFEERDRRLVPVPVMDLGRTPVVDLRLEMGSYLVKLAAPGRIDVDLPVSIGRQEHWDNVAPGDAGPTAVVLPEAGALGPDDCYVPAGWFWTGDPGAHNAVPRQRVWVDGFVIRRFPVTNREFLGFLNDLEAQGRGEEARRWAPGHGTEDGEGASGYRFEEGRWCLGVDGTGDEWLPDHPAMRVDWFAARQFASWLSLRTAPGWRLPMALEWEKAARGVDGRPYPWGTHFDPTWCRSKHSLNGPPLPTVVGAHPGDVGVYGVRDMAGNMNDWCSDGPTDDPLPRRLTVKQSSDNEPLRWIRGGMAGYTAPWCRVAVRLSRPPSPGRDTIGFRMARSFPR
ncbi:MAG: SUMF1/EgtB/PvdO family nonheme iron enzyme [Alphaproteobacteria bacterium]|nr:SUMF1/EgtB/PvdO family nonheme iron enzyme [Alphaproteobacteria bacterium]